MRRLRCAIREYVVRGRVEFLGFQGMILLFAAVLAVLVAALGAERILGPSFTTVTVILGLVLFLLGLSVLVGAALLALSSLVRKGSPT